MLKKILKPSSEKIFVASAPFALVVPVVLYIVLNSFFNLEASTVGSFFSGVAFFCYSFISLFAIPFEELLSSLGMLQRGGGIFQYGLLGLDFAGILTAQFIYAVIFYVLFSISCFVRSGKSARHIFSAKH